MMWSVARQLIAYGQHSHWLNHGSRTFCVLPASGKPRFTERLMFTRKARLQDAQNIYDLVHSLSGDGTLLPRDFAEICENVRDFSVVEANTGEFLGCGALHLYGTHLAEVRSIVVRPEATGRGAGSELVNALLAE